MTMMASFRRLSPALHLTVMTLIVVVVIILVYPVATAVILLPLSLAFTV